MNLNLNADLTLLQRDLADVLNVHGLDSTLDTSDTILAAHLVCELSALRTFMFVRKVAAEGCPSCGVDFASADFENERCMSCNSPFYSKESSNG